MKRVVQREGGEEKGRVKSGVKRGSGVRKCRCGVEMESGEGEWRGGVERGSGDGTVVRRELEWRWLFCE